MPTNVFIYSKLTLSRGRDEVEDALDDVLADAGEVTGGGAGSAGWNIDIELVSCDDTDRHVAGIACVLRELAVPADTYLVVGADQSRVNVYQRDS